MRGLGKNRDCDVERQDIYRERKISVGRVEDGWDV